LRSRRWADWADTLEVSGWRRNRLSVAGRGRRRTVTWLEAQGSGARMAPVRGIGPATDGLSGPTSVSTKRATKQGLVGYTHPIHLTRNSTVYTEAAARARPSLSATTHGHNATIQ
jgi:hypothetical protein